MEAFKVAPFDQNLCLNGLYLTDSSQTLGELRVLPKSLIYLRADEPNPGASVMEPDDGWAMQHPEEGFKGTFVLVMDIRKHYGLIGFKRNLNKEFLRFSPKFLPCLW